MGKGLALLFKFQYPKNFEEYRKYCKEDKLKPGKVLLTEEAGRKIINVATKNHFRGSSNIEWIEDGLKEINLLIKTKGIKVIVLI